MRRDPHKTRRNNRRILKVSLDLTASEIAERLDIRQIWRVLSLPGEPGKCVCSPFTPENHASFSVYREGRWRFKDHARALHGDGLDFIRLAKGCTEAEALAWARSFLGLPDRRRREDVPASGKKRWMPDLRPGSLPELNHLAELRGFGIEALRLAERRGFFGFAEFAGNTCWAVRDKRRLMMEFRRLDGRLFEAYKGLPVRKSHCIGSGKSFPIGYRRRRSFPKWHGWRGRRISSRRSTSLWQRGKMLRRWRCWARQTTVLRMRLCSFYLESWWFSTRMLMMQGRRRRGNGRDNSTVPGRV